MNGTTLQQLHTRVSVEEKYFKYIKVSFLVMTPAFFKITNCTDFI